MLGKACKLYFIKADIHAEVITLGVLKFIRLFVKVFLPIIYHMIKAAILNLDHNSVLQFLVYGIHRFYIFSLPLVSCPYSLT